MDTKHLKRPMSSRPQKGRNQPQGQRSQLWYAREDWHVAGVDPRAGGIDSLIISVDPRIDGAVFIFMVCLSYLLFILTLYHFNYYITYHNYIINL